MTALLGSLGSFPPYFLRLGELNRVGVAVDQPPSLAPLDVTATRRLLADGAHLVDVRPVPDFAAAHVPGSLSIPLRPVFASWLGWLAPHDRPLIILRRADQDPAEIAWQATKIGYTNLAGELTGGLDAWTAVEHPTTSTRLVGPDQVEDRVLDIRQAPEFAAGHLPGARHIELGDLTRRADELPREPMVVMCGHGERAMGAASLLEQAGHRNLAVLTGGPQDWAQVTDRRLETGT